MICSSMTKLFSVFAPNVKANNWCPKQIPNTGKSFLINSLMIGIAYFPVAAGSPGPLDKKIPLGFL